MNRQGGVGGEDWHRSILFVLISIVVIIATIVILLRSGLAKARYELPRYPLYLVISELIYLVQLALVGVRLSIIFNKGVGHRISTPELIKIAAAQTFASLLVPGFYIGGEAVSIAYLTSNGLPTTRATEGITLRYAIDTITLASMALLLYLLNLVVIPYIALVIASVLLIAYAVLFITIVSARLGRYIEGFLRFLSSRINFMNRLIVINENEAYGIKLSLKDYFILFLLSVLQWVLTGLNVTLILNALGINANLLTGIVISISYVVLTYISVLPGSAGIGELVNLYILDSLGLGNYYLAYDVWFRIITYVAPLIILMPIFLSVTRKITIINRRNP
ncbi:MAG: YbhN family protein [Vulcanisaeta sp. AZ3]